MNITENTSARSGTIAATTGTRSAQFWHSPVALLSSASVRSSLFAILMSYRMVSMQYDMSIAFALSYICRIAAAHAIRHVYRTICSSCCIRCLLHSLGVATFCLPPAYLQL